MRHMRASVPVMPQVATTDTTRDMVILMIFGSHMLLGVAVYAVPALSTAIGLVTISAALFTALFFKYQSVAYVAAYICGTEIFWRMTDVPFFWEMGKYMVVLVLLWSAFVHRQVKIPVWLLLYLLLLLPGILPTLTSGLPTETIRQFLSFNLSGPICLFVSVTYFYNLKIDKHRLKMLLVALAAPILMIGIYVLLSLLSSNTEWLASSNYEASGGWGPNQVSMVLGLGSITLMLLRVIGMNSLVGRLFVMSAALYLLFQATLTFSRGGVIVAITCLALLYIASAVTNHRNLIPLIVLASSMIAIAVLFLIPFIETLTQGAFGQRYSNFETERTLAIEAELRSFSENPMGVGVGLVRFAHEKYIGVQINAHTEFTRLLSEHGIAGLLAIIILASSLFFAITRRVDYRMLKIVGLVFVVWSLMSMVHSAMRIAAIGFVFGLIYASYAEDSEEFIKN